MIVAHTARMNGRRSAARTALRGTVLFAVLVVLVMATLIGSTILVRADAQMSSMTATMRQAQARAAAWSGVQAVAAQLLSQREALLLGGTPELDEEIVIAARPGSPRTIARVVELAPGERCSPETARLNVNAATIEMLTASKVFSPASSAKIIQEAVARAFGAVDDVLAFEAESASMKSKVSSGTPAAVRADDPGSSEQNGRAAAANTSLAGNDVTVRFGPPRGVLTQGSAGADTILTVFSADPNIQTGLGEGGAEHRGLRRININVEWSEELGQAVAKRLGQPVADGLKQVMASGRKFAGRGDIVKALRAAGLEPRQWGPFLDAFCTNDEEFAMGLVDVNVASASALACVPGLTIGIGEAIVSARGQLDETALRSVAWPVAQGVVTPEQFELAADWLTTRCFQWRVRIEAGVVKPGSDGANGSMSNEGSLQNAVSPARGSGRPADRSPGSGGNAERVPLEGLMTYEFVIDVATSRPRVALLRDLSLQAPLSAWRASRPAGGIGERENGHGSQTAKPLGSDDDQTQNGVIDGSDFGRSNDREISPTLKAQSDAEEPGTRGEGTSTVELAGRVETRGRAAEPTPPGNGGDRRVGRWRAMQAAGSSSGSGSGRGN